MAISLRNLGFERARNLSEAVNDREILNNLGGGDIASDIALFVNNTNNESELVWEFNTNQSDIIDNKFIFPITVPYAYTHGDIVKVSGSSLGNLNPNLTYYVTGLSLVAGVRRNQIAFGLSLTNGGSLVSLGSINANVTFIRKDEVTQENLLNIATPRILDSNESLVGGRFSYNIGTSFNDAFSTIESGIDGFNFLRSFKYISNDSTITNRNATIEGSIQVSDPAGTNQAQSDLEEDKSPGIYITDPFSDILDIDKTRAYSTDAQPWNEGSGALVTTSRQVNIGDLFFANGIKFDSIVDLNTESGNVSSFTHKIPIVVDGVEYFVLLRS
jgi:hypothetical protein